MVETLPFSSVLKCADLFLYMTHTYGGIGIEPSTLCNTLPTKYSALVLLFFLTCTRLCVCECMCVCVCVCLCMWMLAAILALQTQNFRLELASSHTGGAILPWNKGRKAS